MEIKRLYLPISIILIVIISYLDYMTGYEISFSIFYTIPIILITWQKNIRYGIVFSVVSGIIWLLVDYLSGHKYSHWSMNYWNGFVELLFFIIIVFLIDKIKILIIREKKITRMNTDLVSAISHEFNNLLTTIHMASQLLEETDSIKNPDRIKLYSIINQNYIAMREYIKTLLNKTRLESGKLKLNLSDINIKEILIEIIYSFEPLILDKKLKIEKDFPIHNIVVRGDHELIELILSNLISNAIKYSNVNGKIKISVVENENYVEIAVEDNGIGIKKEELEKINSGFYRTEKGKEHAKGFGIGLKIVNEFLNMHGEKLNIESEEGKGSRFSFKLPISHRI